ncbi:MAG: alpha/beta hydrolase [Deltaproteobacteria bacterium]|nr:alpha/beta hydrolase [Deltaproteobacteria bacterium]
MEERRTKSFDGTIIAYQVFGSGPPLAVGNGIGVDWRGLGGFVDRLTPGRQLILWDYRGTFRSGRPADLDALDPEAHARDLCAVLRAEGIAGPVDYLGWSMGTQVGFELLRVEPGTVGRLIVLSGTAGRPADTALGLSHVGPAIRLGVRLGLHQHRLVNAVLRRAPDLPYLLSTMKAVGWVHPECDEQAFMVMVRGVAATDKEIYLRCLLGLVDHDASDVFGAIDFPVLILAGDRDLATPLRMAKRMHEALPSSELVVLPRCTHYAVVEQPTLVCREIDRFLGER